MPKPRLRLARVLRDPSVEGLLRGIFDGSPYLTGLVDARSRAAGSAFWRARPKRVSPSCNDCSLRRCCRPRGYGRGQACAPRVTRSDVALLTALADLGGVWPVMTVTRSAVANAPTPRVATARPFPVSRWRRQRGCGSRRRSPNRSAAPAISCSPWASTAPSSSTIRATSISSSSSTAKVRARRRARACSRSSCA